MLHRRFLLVAFSVIVLAVAGGFHTPLEAPDPADPTPFVQIGKAKRYHVPTCPHCKSRTDLTPLTAAQAAKLTPCKKCKPELVLAALKPPDPTKPVPVGPADPNVILARVVGVTDGDTLKLLDLSKTEITIRMDGIDAPESKQAFGSKAKQILSEKVFDKDVRLMKTGTDKYGRTLANVYLGERWINYEMIADGFAWQYLRFNTDKRLAAAELAARGAAVGLWSDKNPQPPWDFRAEQKAKAKAKKLNALPHVQKAEARYAVAGAKVTIIQICDWHMIGAEAFVADENDRAGKPLDAEELQTRYAKHLEEVAAVQNEQVELLTALLKDPKVSAVFQEGLTADNAKEYKLLADVLAKNESDPKYREAILRHGATGQLYRAGKIKEVLPLDDAKLWKEANPVKPDGSIKFDKAALAKREDAQVSAILKQSGIVLLVLGGAHDLTDSLRRAKASVEYLRLEVTAYRRANPNGRKEK